MSQSSAARFAPEYAPISERIRAISPDRYDDAVFKHGLDFYRQRIDMMGATGLIA